MNRRDRERRRPLKSFRRGIGSGYTKIDVTRRIPRREIRSSGYAEIGRQMRLTQQEKGRVDRKTWGGRMEKCGALSENPKR